jgi:hypothetical protein
VAAACLIVGAFRLVMFGSGLVFGHPPGEVVKRLATGVLWTVGGVALGRRRELGRRACYAAAVVTLGHNLYVLWPFASALQPNTLLHIALFNGPPLLIVGYLTVGPGRRIFSPRG